jgi:hypothetical protein
LVNKCYVVGVLEIGGLARCDDCCEVKRMEVTVGG